MNVPLDDRPMIASRWQRSSPTLLLLSCICVAGLFLITESSKVDLPHGQIDEMALPVRQAMQLHESHHLRPTTFLYPAVTFYVGKVAADIVALDKNPLRTDRLIRPFRIAVGLLVILSAVPFFFAAGRFMGPWVAVAASALYLFSLFRSTWLYYASPDALMPAAGALVFWSFARCHFSNDPRMLLRRDLPVLFATVGLAAAVKYHGVFFLILPVSLFWTHRKFLFKPANAALVTIGAFSMPGIFLLLNPWMIPDRNLFLSDFIWNMNHYKTGHVGMEADHMFLMYARAFLILPEGWIGAALALFGLDGIRRRHGLATAVTIILVPTVFILMLGRYPIGHPRNISPVLPFHAFLAAASFSVLGSIRIKGHRWVRPILIGFGFILILVLSIRSMALIRSYNRMPSTLFLARAWVMENIPKGSTVVTHRTMIEHNGYTPDLPEGYVFDLRTEDEIRLESVPKGAWLVTTSAHYGRYLQPTAPRPRQGDSSDLSPEASRLHALRTRHPRLAAQFRGCSMPTPWESSVGLAGDPDAILRGPEVLILKP